MVTSCAKANDHGHRVCKERSPGGFCHASRDGNDAGQPGGCVITPAPGTAGGDGHHGRPARADPHRGDHARPSPEPSACTSHRCPGFPATVTTGPGGASASLTARTLNANGCDRRSMRVRLMRVTRVRCRASLAHSPGPGRREAAPPASVAGSRLDGSGPDTTGCRRQRLPANGRTAGRHRDDRGVSGRGRAGQRPAGSVRPPCRPSGLRSRQRRPGARAGCSVVPMPRQQRTSRLRGAGRTRWR